MQRKILLGGFYIIMIGTVLFMQLPNVLHVGMLMGAVLLSMYDDKDMGFILSLCLVLVLGYFVLQLRISGLAVIGLSFVLIRLVMQSHIWRLVIVLCLAFVLVHFNIIQERTYLATDFGYQITDISGDMNGNGKRDIADIIEEAHHQASLHPKYKSAYYAGGIPPDNEGVCTDVIWRVLEAAGYDLKAMIDLDIDLYEASYPYAEDSNIDFRRVRNLMVFFSRNTMSLSLDLNDKESWQPGDIVFFSDTHVGILSDKYNRDGLPLVIHSASILQLNFEEDALASLEASKGISGHYRWILNDDGKALLK